MGAPTQIRVYENKISFWNEGLLPMGLTFEALKGFHASRPRNVLIADVCFKGGYIDSWGRGTLKIFDSCKEAKLPEPEIKEFQGGFLVLLFKGNFNEEHLIKLGLNARQLKAVQYIKDRAEITNAIYQEINNIGKTTATEDLQSMVELGVIVKIGRIGRGTKYILK